MSQGRPIDPIDLGLNLWRHGGKLLTPQRATKVLPKLRRQVSGLGKLVLKSPA